MLKIAVAILFSLAGLKPACAEAPPASPGLVTVAVIVGPAAEIASGKTANFTADIFLQNGGQDFENLQFSALPAGSRIALTAISQSSKKKTSKEFSLALPAEPEKIQLGFTALSNPIPKDFLEQMIAGNPLAASKDPLTKQLAADLKTMSQAGGAPSLLEFAQGSGGLFPEKTGILAVSASTDNWENGSLAAQLFSVKKKGREDAGTLSVTGWIPESGAAKILTPPAARQEITLRVQFYVKTPEGSSFPQIIRFLDEQTYTLTLEPPKPPTPAE